MNDRDPRAGGASTAMDWRLENLLEWFIPDSVRRDPDEARRTRLVVGAALALLFVDVSALFLVPWRPWSHVGTLVLPAPAVSALLMHLVVNLSIAFLPRTGARRRSAAFFLQASLVLFFAWLAYIRGGFHSPVMWWLAAVPLLSTFLSGAAGAATATIVVGLTLTAFYLLDLKGHAFPKPLDADPSTSLDILYAQFVVLAFVSFVGRYYERTRQAVSADLFQAYSQLEHTNQALRASQLNIRQIAEHIGQAIWMHDLRSNRVVYANVGFEQVFHLSRTRLEADARVWLERVLEEDDDRVPRSPDGVDHEYRITFGGETRWIRHSVYGVGEGGQSTRAIHIAADVTIRKSAAALRERFIETVMEVQENERRHLARELHDDTGGSLTALLVGLRGLANTLDREDQKSMVTQLGNQLRTVVADIGRLARGLHPSVLDELGLAAAVRRLAADTRDASEIAVDVRAYGVERESTVSATIRLAAYRIVQEALTNVTRHSKAKRVDVTLTIDAERVQVRIEDDGVGFDPAATDRQKTREVGIGLGVMSMVERANLLRGTVTIESAPGRGTTVIGEIPLNPSGMAESHTSPPLD